MSLKRHVACSLVILAPLFQTAELHTMDCHESEELIKPAEAMLDMITDKQSERMDSQRAELRPAPKKLSVENKGASLPGLRPQQTTSTKPEDDFLDMLARVQGSRLEDQRSELPPPKPEERAKTVPDDDFFALLMRAQAGRMEDQRATIPLQSSTDNRRNKGGSNIKK